MKRTLFPVTFVLFGAVTGAAQAQMPSRKAGLWETTMTGTSSIAAEGGGKVKQCIDAATDRAAMSGAMAAKACQQSAVVKTAAGYEFEATCKIGEMTSKSKSIVTGDFNANVTVRVTSLISTGGGPAKESKTTLESRYIGPCEAGQKPGDIIMPDGKLIKAPGGVQ
jgi:uncharacterized protein DUF3617